MLLLVQYLKEKIILYKEVINIGGNKFMKELIISEFIRMKKRGKNKICIFLSLLSFILSVLWYKTPFLGGGVAFYTPNISTKLNSLNYTIFCMKDLIFVLFLVVFPILFIDSLSGEYESGAYRLILIRPYTKIELWLSKLIVQGIFSLIIFTFFFILSMITGNLVFHKVSTTNFYNTPQIYNTSSAFIYTLKATALIYLVSIAILSVAALISVIIPKVVAAFITLICFLMGSLYVGHGLDVLFIPFHKIIKFLSLGERANFYIPVIACIIIGCVLSTIIFNKKDLIN